MAACCWLKKYDDAFVSYEAALQVETNRPETHFSLALAFFSLRRRDDAARQFLVVITLTPENPNPLLHREALRLKSDFPEAERALNDFGPLQPKYLSTLKVEDAVRESCLMLCDWTACVLKQGLDAIGIDVGEQMCTN